MQAGGKHYEEYGIRHLIHMVILCVNYLICYLFLMFSVNSALYCCLRYMFDIGCLLSPKFNHSNVVWNYYLSTVSSEQLAKVDILKDMLLFRETTLICVLVCL